MKKLIIGRNNACDIIIADTSDLVSRKQAVLVFSLCGKITLYDTSNNGTYVNGQRVENGKGIPVTRKDKINFARIADLDWNEVKNPYRRIKWIAAIIAASVAMLVLLVSLLCVQQDKCESSTTEKIETKAGIGETTTTVKPRVVEEKDTPRPIKKRSKKETIKKEKFENVNEPMNKDVDNNSPIFY